MYDMPVIMPVMFKDGPEAVSKAIAFPENLITDDGRQLDIFEGHPVTEVERAVEVSLRAYVLVGDGQKPNAASNLSERVAKALEIAVEYGGIDGAHHKTWVIDQIVRTLACERYDEFVKQACDGEDGPDTYEWDTGVAP